MRDNNSHKIFVSYTHFDLLESSMRKDCALLTSFLGQGHVLIVFVLEKKSMFKIVILFEKLMK